MNKRIVIDQDIVGFDFGGGVFIESRYKYASEIHRMKTAVSLMQEMARRQLKSVYCDSKEGNYFLETDSWSVAQEFSERLLEFNDDHGVITYGLDQNSAQPL